MQRFFHLLAWTVLLCALSCTQREAPVLEIADEDGLAGLRVASSAGTCYDISLSKRSDIDLLLFNFAGDALQALLAGKVDVMVQDETLLNSEIRSEYGITIGGYGSERFPTAPMFRRDEAELVEKMNAVQRQMREDGRLDSLKHFWLGEEYLADKHYLALAPQAEGETFQVACVCNMAPISFMVGEEWYGIEVALMRELGRALGRPVAFKFYDASSAMIAVKTGMADALIGGVFITPERQEEYLFAEPYHEYRSAFYVRDHSATAGTSSLWQRIRDSLDKNLVKEGRWKYIVSGLWETVKITLLSILLGSVLGIGLCAMTRSRRKWLRSAASLYNGFMAGIPMLVLLLILFYVVFAKSGLNPMTVAVIAFALNFASGASDVYGTSLDAVPHGQTEGGLALGFTRLQTFTHIVLPQAVRRGLPLFQGQCISLLKGTSIVGYIAIQDLTRAGDLIRSRTFDAFVPLLVVTVIYFVLAWLLGLLVKLASPKTRAL